ncbi:L-ascorbate oxidase [Amanita muscaria]
MPRLCSSLFLITSLLFSSVLGYQWPDPQYEQLEQFLYEGRRADGSNLASLVHPCRKREGTLSSIGAEWLRFAFHDMSTHDSTAGTGGLDASITYELNYTGNFGQGFINTQTDFESFPNKYVSRSDIIALGAVFAVSSCGGPIIPFRGGRVDALAAGPATQPEPQQTLQQHRQLFTQMGFSQSEMIQLVACGHTLGSVRSPDFPNLVPPNASDPNTPVFADFDSTMTKFDNNVVTEYLDGTTQNPLVVTSNATLQSDLRVFSSDGNATMKGLSTSGSFMSSCQGLLQRMIDTVPHGVSFTEEIQLIPAKILDVGLSIQQNQLLFKASLRLVQPTNTTANSKRVVTMFWCDRYGNNAFCGHSSKFSLAAQTTQVDPNSSPVSYTMGISFIRYDFVVPIDSTVSISKFWFQVDEKNGSNPTVYDNSGTGYSVNQDQVIYTPALGTTTYSTTPVRRGGGGPVNVTYSKTYYVVAAVRQELNPSNVYMNAYDSAIKGYTSVFNQTVQLSPQNGSSPVAGYKFYTGSVTDGGLQLTVDVHAEIDGQQYLVDFLQTSNLGSVPYITPTNVTESSTTISSTHNAASASLPSLATTLVSLGAALTMLLVLS